MRRSSETDWSSMYAADHDHARRRLGDTDKLTRASRALENVARAGVSFAGGSSELFPLPALALRAHRDELRVPLGESDTQRFKAHATVASDREQEEDAEPRAVCEVGGAALESRNERWPAFLEGQFTAMRQKLGVSPSAQVSLSLQKMVLVEAGGRLCLERVHARGAVQDASVVFGALVVTLPGAFTGSEFVIQRALPNQPPSQDDRETRRRDEYDDMPTTWTWRPSARGDDYGITFAALYAHSQYEITPVESGAALFAVYDLVTTTPMEVPMFAGPERLQNVVEDALTTFFDVAPAPLVKRFKIGPDAWRAVNEFVSDRPFVYIVESSSTFQNLCEGEQAVSQSLEAFCARSGGQFVLYIAQLYCEPARNSTSTPAGQQEMKIQVQAPWRKLGESEKMSCPAMDLRHEEQVAPTAGIERIRIRLDDTMIRGCGVYTNALVVLPAPIEARQLEKLPIDDAVVRLERMLAQSSSRVTQYARQIMRNQLKQPSHFMTKKAWSQFFQLLTKINDLELFLELLRTLPCYSDGYRGLLGPAFVHFGWATCLDTLVSRVLAEQTWGERVSFIVLVVYKGLKARNIAPLLDALLSLYPWTEIEAGGREPRVSKYCEPADDAFTRLLVLAFALSPDKLKQVALLPRASDMVKTALPGLLRIAYQQRDARGSAHPVMVDICDHIEKLATKKHNLLVPLPEDLDRPSHCSTCRELHSFLTSNQTERALQLEDTNELGHIQDVLARENESRQGVLLAVEPVGVSILVLSKTRQFDVNDLPNRLQNGAQTLRDLVAG